MKKQSDVNEKSRAMAEQIESFRRTAKRVIIKSTPFRVSITPRGIEKFNDKSITYRRGGTTWYKAHSEAEPEITVFKGLPIWSYNEFIGDVDEEGVSYRIAYNPISEKILAYRIEFFEGSSLLENPANTVISKKYEELILEENLPEKDLIATTFNLYKRMKKRVEELRKKREPEKQPVGNKPKANLIRAALWCVRNHPKNLEYKRKTLLRAYKKFGEETQTEDSFVRLVNRKWNDFDEQYKSQPEEFKKQNSKEIYAKKILRVPRNSSKQNTKENKIGFN
jgi:hypothetical protein